MAGARLVAVCDREPLMAEQLAVRYAVPRHYSSLEHLLEREQPDVLHITTPPHSHLPLAQLAVDAGCHVYVEKPLALDYEGARSLVDYVSRAGKKLTIGYLSVFDPTAQAMRELIRRGVVGEPVHVESYYGYTLAGPFGAALLRDPDHWVRRLPGRLFHNTLDHMLNKVTEFIPDERPEVLATAYTRRALAGDELPNDLPDELRVMIRGARVSAYATFSAHARPVGHFLRLYGTRGTLHADFVSRTVTLDQGPKLPGMVGRLLPGFGQALQLLRATRKNVARFARGEFQYFAGMSHLLDAFYQSIREDTPPPIPYPDMLRVAAWMDEVFAQIHPGEGAR